MDYKIYWKFFCKVKSVVKAEKILQEISKIINDQIIPGKIEQYWKDKELYEVNFILSLEYNNVEEAVFNTLKFADTLSSAWYIQTPSFYTQEKVDFSGSANNDFRSIRLQSVETIFFEMKNYD